MKTNNAIYKLSQFLDDPRYQGFRQKRWGELPISVPDNCQTRRWRVHRFARWWKPMKVAGRPHSFNDNPGIDLYNYPVFSRRAVDALRDLLEPNGEILPLVSTSGEYYLYNTTTVADVLDWRHSKVVWAKRPIRAMGIPVYKFYARKVDDRPIFRIPEEARQVYVNETFVTRVHENQLRGFRFDKVWPLPPGVFWRDLVNKDPDHEEPTAPVGLRQRPGGSEKTMSTSSKGNYVLLQFNLINSRAGANREERQKLTALEDQLQSLLAVNDPAIIPAGCFEGSKTGPGRHRMIFSCPNSNVLANKLEPALKKLDWKPGWTLSKSRKSFYTFSEMWGD